MSMIGMIASGIVIVAAIAYIGVWVKLEIINKYGK